MVGDTFERVEVIKRRMNEAWGRNKSYGGFKRRHIELVIRDIVYMKISPDFSSSHYWILDI